MSEEQKCQWIEKIADDIAENGIVPQEDITHARTCEHCFFWLSAALAMLKAFFTTNRRALEDCPAKYRLRNLLFLEIRKLRTAPESILEENLEGLKYVARECGEGYAAELQEHLEECELCKKYFKELYIVTLAEQGRYEEAIENEGLITILQADTSVEEIISQGSMAANSNKKPN